MIRDARAALALLEERGALTLGALASAIAGETIRGSWWAHPKGKLVYAIASELEDRPDVLACKLLGRATFVHRALWAPLVRVVTDEGFRRAAERSLSLPARRLARRTDAPARLDKKTLSPRERAALERSCILHISSAHTERGAHATIVRSWSSWAPKDVARAARAMSLPDARAALAARGLSLV